MKYIKLFLTVIVMTVGLVACDGKKENQDVFAGKIYNFYQPTCPHCHAAMDYISKAYPNLKMEMVDVTTSKDNFDLFVKCAEKFELGNQIGTPLLCMDTHYIMGWSEENQKLFDEYVKEFIK